MTIKQIFWTSIASVLLITQINSTSADIIFDAFTDSTSIAQNGAASGTGASTITGGVINLSNNTTGNANVNLTSTATIASLISAASGGTTTSLVNSDVIRLSVYVDSIDGELTANGIEFGVITGSPTDFRGVGSDANTLLRLRPDGTGGGAGAFPNEPGLSPDNIFVANSGSDGFFDNQFGAAFGPGIDETSLEDGFFLTQEISINGVTNTISDILLLDGSSATSFTFPTIALPGVDASGNFIADGGLNTDFVTFFNGAHFNFGTQVIGTGSLLNNAVISSATIELNPVPEPTSTFMLLTVGFGICVRRRRC